MSGMRVKDAVIKIDKHILEGASRIYRPSFDTDTQVPVEKVFEIKTTAPSMIRFQVAIILPIVSRENVGAPQTNIELIVRVPLRTRWGRHLLHLLSGIGFSPGNRCR